ncbi:YgaP-like transmembrane domain [Tepidibacter aestuarii]|uniref:YgaP-like transmembrane domain n=1 Tax=Tepidibacter aestuarii TaxID=2925782 RepID=UPI0020BD8296|nr:YgaP-like transmembrane domain [Tepidibacter aestuarii]CAH2213268.1 conserved protein of unknown function [Tepidibacter aestuarii]
MELNFKRNLGNTDRGIRITIGIITIMLVYGNILNGWWGILAIIIALSQFIEGFLGY